MSARGRGSVIAWVVLVLGSVWAGEAEPPADRTAQDCFWARQLIPEQAYNEKVIRFQGDDRGGFTYFSPEVEDLRVAGGALTFRLGADKAVLGWGNYGNRVELAQRPELFEEINVIEVRARHLQGARTDWQAAIWADGRRGGYGRADNRPVYRGTLEGDAWQTVVLELYELQFPVPDGFELTVQGEPGTEVAIESVRVRQPVVEGYCRYEFDLPENAQVFRAIAEAGNSVQVYVNGQLVDRTDGIRRFPHTWWGIYWATSAADISAYLRPGRNCIGIYGRRVGPTAGHRPFYYAQAQVVLGSGETVRVGTDEAWRYSRTAAEGWCEPGFDDADWVQVTDAAPPYVNMHHGNALPGYDGALLLRAADGGKLFFDAAKPVQVRVQAPSGWAGREPVLHWWLRRETLDGGQAVDAGEATLQQVYEGALTRVLDLGERDRGVYSLRLSLRDGDEVLAERPREPLMVTGPIPMDKVDGSTYTEGLDLTLEDTIDFTDPADEHRWVETAYEGREAVAVAEPRIVDRDGLRYRETQVGRGCAFLYEFEFERPGSWYMIEVDYPNDKDRFICVSVTKAPLSEVDEETGKLVKPERIYASQAGVQICTGVKLPLTDEMRTLRFLHVADAGPHSIDVASGLTGTAAAAARVRVYRIAGRLPAMRLPQDSPRRFGIHTERTHLGSGFTKNLGVRHERRLFTDEQIRAGETVPVRALIQDLILFQEATENYAQYLRFTGQDFHVMGVFQYNEGNTPYRWPVTIPTGRVPWCIKSVLAEVLDANGVEFAVGVEYSQHWSMGQGSLGMTNASQLARGHDTVRLVNRAGGIFYDFGRPIHPLNPNHPQVRAGFRDVIQDMIKKFGHKQSFRGVQVLMYPDDLWMPSYYCDFQQPYLYSYDDRTFAAFEEDTGVHVPVSAEDPQRFQKRYSFVMQEDVKPQWTGWRCRSLGEFVQPARDLLVASDPERLMLLFLYMDTKHVRTYVRSGMAYRDFIRQIGHDPAAFRDDPNVYYGRWMMGAELHHALRHGPRDAYAAYWEHHVGEEVLRTYDHPERRAVFIMNQWDELQYESPPGTKAEYEWTIDTSAGRFHPQATGDYFKEPYAQAMIGADPDLLLFGFTDVNVNVGWEQKVREYSRVLRRLPRGKFQPVAETGFTTNLALRELRTGGGYYLYVVNPGYWPIEGEIQLTGAERVENLVTGEEVGPGSITVRLAPYGIAAFRADTEGARVALWSNEPVPVEEVAHTRALFDEASDLVERAEVLAALSAEDTEFLRAAIAEGRQALADGQVARAWHLATNWRFWTLTQQTLQEFKD